MRWVDFEYRGFHDVARMIVIHLSGGKILLESRFDDAADDYDDHYTVFRLPASIDLSGAWTRLTEAAGPPVGSVPVGAVTFDETRRRQLDLDSLVHALPEDLRAS